MLAALAGTEMQAQTLQSAPRLVVNITIDQLRTDYIEHFSPLYGEEVLPQTIATWLCLRSCQLPILAHRSRISNGYNSHWCHTSL